MKRTRAAGVVRGGAAALALCCGAAAALAGPGGNTVELFGQVYEVQRFNYDGNFMIDTAGVYIPIIDPMNPPAPIQLIESENIQYIGNDRVIIGSADMLNYFNVPSSIIIEAEILYSTPGDPMSEVVGFQTVRTITSVTDSGDQAPLLSPADQFASWRLRPSGLTVNTGTVGLGAGGNIVASSTRERLYAFDITGTDMVNNAYLGIPLPAMTGDDCVMDPEGCTLRTEGGAVENTDLEDVVFVPSQTANPNDARFYTVSQDEPFSVVVFDTNGTGLYSFPVANTPGVTGEPKGITYFENSATNPFGQPVVIVSLDDLGPGLEVYDLAGNLLAREDLFTATPGLPGSGGPGSDSCSSAEMITGFGVGTFEFDLAGATTDGNAVLNNFPASLTCPRAENDVWFKWTSPIDGLVTLVGDLDVLASDPDFELVVQIFDTTSCAPGGELVLDCGDTDTLDANIDVAWIATSGNEYLIRFASAKDACPEDLGGTGGCCLPDTTCVETTGTDCASQGGTYFGDGTLCMDIDCTQDMPCDPMAVPYGRGTFGLTADSPLTAFDVSECLRQLQFESLTVQPETGRLILNQQGDVFECNFLYVLTPVAEVACPCDFDGSQVQDLNDYFAFLGAFLSELNVGNPQPGVSDFDGSGLVDLNDYFAFLGCLPNLAAQMPCE